MKEYPEYKETQAFGISKIPISWQVQHGFALFEENKIINKDGRQTLLLQFNYGEIVPKKNQDAEIDDKGTYLKYSVIKPGYILINGLNLNYDFVSQRVAVTNYEGAITSAYLSFKCRNRENLDYIKYLLKGLDGIKLFHSLGSGLRQTLTSKEVLQMQLPIPPISEQNAIVKYLDYKTKQIDEFVSAKEKEIESLQELKKTLVADAVTKGISGEELVDSGIEWLPKVPKGWAVHTLRHLLKAFSEKNHSEMQLLSVTRELGVIVRDVEDTESNHNFIPDDLSNYKMVKKGQFVINKMKAWQGSYGVSDFDGIVSPAYFIFDLDFENKEFFHLAIRSRKYADFFARYSDGIRIGQWDLSMLDMKNIPFFVPPIEEQEKIVKYCKDKVRNIDTLITSIQKQVTLVKELRTKLTADVVTGKIDVRDVEIPA